MADNDTDKKFIIDGVAASPFDDYPGQMSGFPDVFNGRMYRDWLAANQKRDDDPPEAMWRHYPHHRILLNVIKPDIDIELPEGQDITDPDTLDARLLWWFSQIVLEYLTPFLMPGG
jgi:hypothetical protein